MKLAKLLAAVDRLSDRKRWALRQHLAGPNGHYYGDGGTIHSSGHVDVEVRGGMVVSVWFRCQILQFQQHDVEADRAQEMVRAYDLEELAQPLLRGVELRGR